MSLRPRSHGSLYVRDERDDGSFLLGAFVALVAETAVILLLFGAVVMALFILSPAPMPR